jgi:putative membrane protein
MRITLALIFALLLALVVTIFAVQNNETTNITFLIWEAKGSLALVLMITFASGILIGLLVSAPGTFKRRRQLSDLKKHMQSLEKDLAAAFQPSAPAPEDEPAVEPEAGPEVEVENDLDQKPPNSAEGQDL